MAKKATHRFLSPILGVYSDVKYIVQSGMNALSRQCQAVRRRNLRLSA